MEGLSHLRYGEPEPIVIGHRGAPGYRPEHSLASFEYAARVGAQYLEPDLVATKDGVLIVRHEPMLGSTTDVAERPEFADRRKTRAIDGKEFAGEWFADDFTLAEIKMLRAVEPLPERRQHNTIHDGRYEIATFEELIDLADRMSVQLGREIGLYPETKHPSYFDRLGKPLTPALVDVLNRTGLNRPDAPVYVQSFEVTNLRELREELDVGLVQLTWIDGSPYDRVAGTDPRTYAEMMTREGLAEIATYADAVGPRKDSVIPRDEDGRLGEPTSLVADAHAAGLAVHAYTFRAENAYLPAEFRSSAQPAAWGDLFGEIDAFRSVGIDGLFTDHPDLADEALRATSPTRAAFPRR